MSRPLHDLTATELLTSYADKSLSPVDVMRSVLDRAATWNPRINALIFLDADSAMEQAATSEARWMRGQPMGPLDGVPITIKDSIAVAGRPMWRGIRANRKSPPVAYDAPPAARVREAGAIIFAKTTMPDFGALGSGVSSAFGVTRNPWNLACNTGGSSSGAAASLAARIGPLSLGTDRGGSVRIPAAHCGLVALKPTQGLIPHLPASLQRSTGPMTRTTEDAALLMSVLSGPDPRDHYSLEPRIRDFRGGLADVDLAGVRVGLITQADYEERPIPAVMDAVNRAARLFADQGAVIEPMAPVADHMFMETVQDVFIMRAASELASAGCTQPGDTLDYFFDIYRDNLKVGSVTEMADAMMRLERIEARAVQNSLAYDYILSPISTISGYPAEALHPDPARPQAFGATYFTPIWNNIGNPAASICCGFDAANGMPIGLQIVGRRFDDLGVLRMTAMFEQMRDFEMYWPD